MRSKKPPSNLLKNPQSTPHQTQTTSTKTLKKKNTNSPLQRINRFPSHILTNTQRFNPRLLHLFQHARTPDMWVCRIPRAELTGTRSGPAAFCIISGAGVATRTGGEDGGFTGRESEFGYVEDELETRGVGTHLCHPGYQTWVDH